MKWISILLLLGMGAGSSLSGLWRGSFRPDGSDGNVPQLITFKQAGNTLTGTGGPDASEQYPIDNGQIHGDRVHFEITTGRWKFFYDLTLSGATLAGKLTLKSDTETRHAEVKLTVKP